LALTRIACIICRSGSTGSFRPDDLMACIDADESQRTHTIEASAPPLCGADVELRHPGTRLSHRAASGSRRATTPNLLSRKPGADSAGRQTYDRSVREAARR